MSVKKIVFTLLSLLIAFGIKAQDDLEALLLNKMDKTVEYTYGTFLSTHVLNNQSTEMLNKHGIGFRISHQFGNIASGANKFFGFDDANSFMEVNYAISDWCNIGLGRATINESAHGFSKFRLLRQSKGARVMPVSAILLLNGNYTTRKYDDPERDKNVANRLDYTTQLIIARKIRSQFSSQLIPTYIHRNLVGTKNDRNNILALGIGATYKIRKKFSFNLEYFLVQNHDTPSTKYYNPLSLGIGYQTSRHAMELFVTNAYGITENNYIANTINNFNKSDIRIGFNISTVFSLKSKK